MVVDSFTPDDCVPLWDNELANPDFNDSTDNFSDLAPEQLAHALEGGFDDPAGTGIRDQIQCTPATTAAGSPAAASPPARPICATSPPAKTAATPSSPTLVSLCRMHHPAVTEGGWKLAMTPTGTITVKRGRHTATTDPPTNRRL